MATLTRHPTHTWPPFRAPSGRPVATYCTGCGAAYDSLLSTLRCSAVPEPAPPDLATLLRGFVRTDREE